MNLSVFNGTIALGMAIAVFCGALLYRRLSHWGPVGRMAGAFLPLFGLLALGDLTVELIDAPYYHWNPPRLAPAFALWHGCAMYYGPDNGPVLGNIYGPGLAFAYLPAVIFPLPSQALKSGAFLTAIYFFLPLLAWHLKGVGTDCRRWVLAGLAMIWFLFVTGTSPPLAYIAFSIHADAPAVCLCGLACVFLSFEKGRNSWRTVLPAALCSVLAVWTKQTAAPILLAVPLYLWFAEGRRACARYLLYLGACLAIVSSVFLLWFGVKPLLFNMFVVPGRHPWLSGVDSSPVRWIRNIIPPGPTRALLEAAGQLRKFSASALVVLAGYFVYRRFFSPAKLISAREWFKSQPWTLPALVGLCLVPTSLLGRVKVGGDVNSLAFSCYFFFLAASLVLRQTAARIFDFKFHAANRLAGWLAFGGCFALSLFLWQNAKFDIRRFTKRPPELSDQAYYFIRQHPGESYFPWNPLAHLMAEQKLYHFWYGVHDRELAGFPLSEEHLREGLPPQLKLVVLANGSGPINYLPEFSQPDPRYLAGMPGWVFYARKP